MGDDINQDKSVIIISLDAVRPDHLSCYGYDSIRTPNIDEIAANGILFENSISASCLTPVSMASTLTGLYPDKHGLRDPFKSIKRKTIAEFFKSKDYKTAGFVGIDLLNAKRNFSRGFDVFKEPTEDVGWHNKKYKDQESSDEINTIWGYWWVDEFLDFIEQNCDNKFFVWGHYFETHVAAERWLLGEGFIEEGVLSDWDYYDAKIKCVDEKLFKPLIKLLKERRIWEDTTLIVMSDHGETFEEHPHKDNWPQHQSMYNTDLRSALIVKNKDLGRDISVKNKVRTIDVVPTLLELFDEKTWDLDGESLIPLIKENKQTNRVAYSEELYELRGYGSLQAIQDERFKLIRNNTRNELEFYDLQGDPLEKNNLVGNEGYAELIRKFEERLDEFLKTEEKNKEVFTKEEEDRIKERLKALGYI